MQQRRFTRNLRKKRSPWCDQRADARSPVILGLGYRRWFAGLVRPGSACSPIIGSRERCDGGAEAAAPEGWILRQERDIPEEGHRFRPGGSR